MDAVCAPMEGGRQAPEGSTHKYLVFSSVQPESGQFLIPKLSRCKARLAPHYPFHYPL